MLLVTGASGFVGQMLLRLCDDVVACPSLRDATQDEVRRIVDESGAQAIVHTAAISDIGACQADPEASFRANVLLPVYLAKAAGTRKLVCFSSDQVYSGMEDDGPYTEARVKPANLYAEQKLEMERRVSELCPGAVMLRAQWMYGPYWKKSNYFMNILNAEEAVAFSPRQYRGITYVKEVAENMEAALRLPGGSYNFGSETTKSMYELTEEFLALIGKKIRLEEAAPRHNLWMNCEKARSFGVSFRSVEDGLKDCARDYGLL